MTATRTAATAHMVAWLTGDAPGSLLLLMVAHVRSPVRHTERAARGGRPFPVLGSCQSVTVRETLGGMGIWTAPRHAGECLAHVSAQSNSNCCWSVPLCRM